MDFKRVAIIGTNCISLSIALSLKAEKEPPEIVGYDDAKVAADLARAQGAFDRVERRPGQACEDADLVIVAVPLTEMRETFAAIAPHLAPGCLVTDTARLKAPVMRWAEELLPENVTFVGGHPIINPAITGMDPVAGLDEASADLLAEALYCFTTPPGVTSATINALDDLALMFDAHPFFIDVTEHDGLQSGVVGLPDLLSVALLRATVDTPGWEEMRKFAGPSFATATAAAADDDDAAERHTSIYLNREHIVRRLNVLLTELVSLRDVLSKDDADLVEETFTKAVEGREQWIMDRERGMWASSQAIKSDQAPSLGKQIRQMFLGDRFTQHEKDAPEK